MSLSVEDAIFQLLAEAGEGRSIAPEQAARLAAGEIGGEAAGDGWRRVLPQVRATAFGLARQGRLVILRHGKPADPDAFKGVYRLKAADGAP